MLLSPLRWLFRLHLAIQVLMVLVVVVGAYLAITFVEVWQASRQDSARDADAIVVLGAAQYNGRPSGVFRARLDHAGDLYRRGIAPVVVVTGGKADGDRFTEAAAGANYLHTAGVPDDQILRETSSHNSWESLAAAARFLKERGMTRVVLVSDPFHAERIDAIADEVGLEGYPSPTRTSPINGFESVRRMGSETVKVAIGRLIGFRRMMNLGEAGTALAPFTGTVAGLGRILPG